MAHKTTTPKTARRAAAAPAVAAPPAAPSLRARLIVNGALTITLERAPEPGRKFTKFTTGEWQSGQDAVNATVYVPNADAAGIASVTVTLRGTK
jgi:hypothetical protein